MSINDKVSQALQWLEDEGWSELIDSRWTLEVYDELQKSGLDLTDDDIRKALDIVIYDKPDYNPANNERHKTKSETHPNIRKVVFWDIDMDTLDWTLNKDFIINRVKERGNAKEINSINEYYGNH